jgi:hypothetical protein
MTEADAPTAARTSRGSMTLRLITANHAAAPMIAPLAANSRTSVETTTAARPGEKPSRRYIARSILRNRTYRAPARLTRTAATSDETSASSTLKSRGPESNTRVATLRSGANRIKPAVTVSTPDAKPLSVNSTQHSVARPIAGCMVICHPPNRADRAPRSGSTVEPATPRRSPSDPPTKVPLKLDWPPTSERKPGVMYAVTASRLGRTSSMPNSVNAPLATTAFECANRSQMRAGSPVSDRATMMFVPASLRAASDAPCL